MTDHDDERDFVRALFASAERPPADIVPTAGLTREALERQSAAYGKPCTGTIPGEILTDPDGYPLGVAESRSVSGIFGGVGITATEAERLGIKPGELPGVFIIETENEGK
jgi:hypothetical protein